MFVQYFFIWVILSICCMILAENRGRDGGRWLVISILISPLLSLILLLVMKNLSEEKSLKSGDKKKCMFCAETINADAIKCKHCGSMQSIKPENLNEKELNELIDKLQKK